MRQTACERYDGAPRDATLEHLETPIIATALREADRRIDELTAGPYDRAASVEVDSLARCAEALRAELRRREALVVAA